MHLQSQLQREKTAWTYRLLPPAHTRMALTLTPALTLHVLRDVLLNLPARAADGARRPRGPRWAWWAWQERGAGG